MTIDMVMAQATVTDLDTAIAWYTKVFGRAPDARPMPGLAEWRFGDTHGVQVWAEPDRAGKCSMVLRSSDLDALVAELDRAGIAHDDPKNVTESRILPLTDPDGNRVFLTGV